ncbi:MAG: head GIN domain-containing protein [Bacteroidota bacterium]
MKSRWMSHALLFVLTMMVGLAAGCSTEDTIVSPDQVVGSGKLVSEDRTVGTFAGIRVTGIANVVIRQDPVQALRIEADDNVADRVTTTVEGGLLTVGLERGSYSKITVNVYASMATVRRLEVIGSANFSTTTPIQTDSLTCRITGTGNMTLQGSANAGVFEITGAGAISAFNLNLERCWSLISGTGNIEVNVSHQLTASITGVGSITYAGNPSMVNQSVTGVGSVKPRP